MSSSQASSRPSDSRTSEDSAERSAADFVLPHVQAMHSYVPGLQLNDPEIIKLNSNENPFPPGPRVQAALRAAVEENRLQLYPDPRSSVLRKGLAAKFGLAEESVIVTNGSDEGLILLLRALMNPGDRFVLSNPTYVLYPILADMVRAEVRSVSVQNNWRMDLAAMLSAARDAKLTALVSPNANTGIEERRSDVLRFAEDNPNVTLVDEAYAEFGSQSVADRAGQGACARMVVSGTFSKTYSLAGQRIGWLLGHPDLIRQLDKLRDSYNVSRLAQVAGAAVLEDDGELQHRIRTIRDTRDALLTDLAALGFDSLPSSANFILTRPPAQLGEALQRLAASGAFPAPESNNAAALYHEYLKSRKVLIRYFGAGGGERLADYVRISIGTPVQMEGLLALTRRALEFG